MKNLRRPYPLHDVHVVAPSPSHVTHLNNEQSIKARRHYHWSFSS